MKLDAPGEYVVTVAGTHKTLMTTALEKNEYIPRCSKVSMYYQLVKVSDIQTTYDEEFAAETGSIDDSNDNCKDIEIDKVGAIQKAIESQRVNNYMDINAKILIPDPSKSKKVTFVIRSSSKPILSVVKVTASLPEDIRLVTSMKFQLVAVEAKGKQQKELSLDKSIRQHEQDLSFVIDDTESKVYLVSIEFEEVDFELLQTHCSFLEVRIAREPAFNVLATLGSFEKSKRYSDLADLKNNPKTVTIDKEKSVKLAFYRTKNAIDSQKSTVLGKITIDVKIDQVQLDILAEYNYISSLIQLQLVGDENFSDVGVFEVDDEHFNSNQIYTARNSIRTIGTGDVFQKGTYTLLIKTDKYSQKLLKTMKENDIDVMDDLTIPFFIKIESTPVSGDLKPTDGKLRLIDIEYNEDPDNDGKALNSLQDLSIVLEFNENLDNTDLALNDPSSSFAVLKLDTKYHKGVKKGERVVKPSSMDKDDADSESDGPLVNRMSSQSTIKLVFPANSLKPGATYTLQLDSNIGINQDLKDFDMLTLKILDTKCNPKGVVLSKANAEGRCKCKYPYAGPTCYKCQDDYNFNPKTSECILFETCLEDTCNGHGQCFVSKKSGRAKCICDPGFKDDEEGERCASCVNEKQYYPDCTLKTKVGLKSSACYGVPAGLVPKHMKDSGSLWKEKVGDIREFSRTYAVKKANTVESIDLPIIDESTVLKIFYKVSPGLSCKVKITDSNKNIIFESSKLYQHGSFSAMLDPEIDEKGEAIHEKGHVIFEYSRNETLVQEDKEADVVPCWKNEVILSMNPYSELIQNSKCDYVKNSEFSSKLKKLDNQLFDIYEFNLDQAISLDERIVLENQKLKLRFKHNYGTYDDDKYGNLLILVHYDFPFLSMNSKLNQVTGKAQKFLKFGSTDAYEEEMGTETSLNQMANSIVYIIPNTFYRDGDSYLEAEFSITDKFLALFDETVSSSSICFPLNVMVEYVPPSTGANVSRKPGEEDESRIQLIRPSILKDIPINKFHNITLQLDLQESIIDAYPSIDPASALSGTMIAQMCALEHSDGSQFDFYEINTIDMFSKTNTIFPIEYSVSEDYTSVFLQFPVTQAYPDSCYKLVCKTDPSILQGTYLDVKETSNIATSYCFGKEVSGNALANKNCARCNPLGTSDCKDNGKCKCAHPYTGEQ